MNIASQLFKRATFPLSGNNVVVQNLLRKLSTSCFFRMSLCLQLIKRPVFTAKRSPRNSINCWQSSDRLLALRECPRGIIGGGEGKARWRPQWYIQSSCNFLCVLHGIGGSDLHIIVAAILTVRCIDDVP